MKLLRSSCYSKLFRFCVKITFATSGRLSQLLLPPVRALVAWGPLLRGDLKPSMCSCQFMLHALGWKEAIWINVFFFIGGFAFDLCTYSTTAPQPLHKKKEPEYIHATHEFYQLTLSFYHKLTSSIHLVVPHDFRFWTLHVIIST